MCKCGSRFFHLMASRWKSWTNRCLDCLYLFVGIEKSSFTNVKSLFLSFFIALMLVHETPVALEVRLRLSEYNIFCEYFSIFLQILNSNRAILKQVYLHVMVSYLCMSYCNIWCHVFFLLYGCCKRGMVVLSFIQCNVIIEIFPLVFWGLWVAFWPPL